MRPDRREGYTKMRDQRDQRGSGHKASAGGRRRGGGGGPRAAPDAAAPDAIVASADGTALRIVVGDRRAASQAELAARLARSGHDVIARVTSLRAALENAEYFKPDAVLFAPYLEDGLGVAAALACANAHPGIAAVVLTPHPGASNPQSRPDWGSVSLAPIEATAEELDVILRAAVARAREATPRAPRPQASDARPG
jgi:DNA-binding NtrC family response regulator